MSSPIHYAEDLDPALRYAPPWARDPEPAADERPVALPSARQARNRAVNKITPNYTGDRAMIALQRQLALDPDAIPEPCREDAPVLRPIVLRFGGVAAVAALVAWGFVSLPGPKKAVPVAQSDLPTPAVNRVKVVAVRGAAPEPSLNEGVAALNHPPALATSWIVPPPPSRPGDPPLQLDSEEIATLVKRGKDFLTNGDLASARLLLRRAAEAGNAEGALALGATFDPVVIRRLGAIGAAPDIARAREWYEKAATLGSTEAPQLLAKLASE
jgi:hypothetical protein